jgi:His-Xaa-Ser system radical SAM maturase HxsB
MAIIFQALPKSYRINKYKYKVIDDKIIVSTINGGWAILSPEEFQLLRHEKVEENPNLFKTLEEQGIIITDENIHRIAKMFADRKSFLFNSVSLHIISVTLRCNHKCIYCHAKSRGIEEKQFDMDEKTAKKVIDFIFQSPSRHLDIEFQGGEPLANFQIIQFIVDYAKKLAQEKNKHIKFNIVSNFTLMDEDILDFLIENKFNINTSLDGPKNLHDKNRIYMGGSSYEKAVYWIKVIKERNYHIAALPTISKFSLPFWKEIIDEYKSLGLMNIRLRQMNNAGLANENWLQIGYSPQEFIDFWKKGLDYIIELNKQGVKMIEGMAQLALQKLISKNYKGYTCWGWPCGAALSQCGYNYNGDIYTCDEARSFEEFKIGDVNQTYKEVFLSPTVAGFINTTSSLLNKCNRCVWQPFCGPCLVCTFGQQKRMLGDMNVDNECFIRQGMLETVVKKLMKEEEREILLKWL